MLLVFDLNFLGDDMFKNLLFLSLCAFSSIVAVETPALKGENLQVGRYQLVYGKSKDAYSLEDLFLLDTATGYVWHSKAKANWCTDDVWELQIATPPEHPAK